MDLFQSEVSKVFPFEWLTVSKNGQQLKHLEEMEAKAKDALSYTMQRHLEESQSSFSLILVSEQYRETCLGRCLREVQVEREEGGGERGGGGEEGGERGEGGGGG